MAFPDRRPVTPPGEALRAPFRAAIMEPTAEAKALAKERLANPANTLIVIDKIHGIPGVSYTATVVRDKDFSGLGGWRMIERDVIQGNLDNARQTNPGLVDHIFGGRGIEDESAAAGAFEAWKLGDQMKDKYANMRRIIRRGLETNSALFPDEMRKNPDAWLAAASLVGGVKSVTVIEDKAAYDSMSVDQRRSLIEQHAAHIARVNDQAPEGVTYYTAPDMKSNSNDLTILTKDLKSPFGASYDEAEGGSGDPSPTTALGVAYTTLAAADYRSIAEYDRTFAIQGVGKVGGADARIFRDLNPSAEVYVADVNVDQARRVAVATGAIPTAPDGIHTVGNIYIPAATSEVLTTTTVPEIIAAGVEVIVPAANAVYQAGRDDELSQQLHDAGVTAIPAAHANLGGIWNIMGEFVRVDGQIPDREITDSAIVIMGPATTELLAEAHAAGVPPQRIFTDHALAEYTLIAQEKGLIPV